MGGCFKTYLTLGILGYFYIQKELVTGSDNQAKTYRKFVKGSKVLCFQFVKYITPVCING